MTCTNLFASVSDAFPTKSLILNVSPLGLDVNKVHPYSTFLNNRKLAGGGWVRKLNANKDLVVQELKRRDPMARPNKSNRGSEELVKLFPPIIDLRDIAFITKKEGEFRRKMMNTLNECEMKPKRGRNSVGGQSSASPASTPFKRPRIAANLCVNLGGNIAGGSQNVQPNGTILSSQAADKVMASAEQLALDYGWKVSIAISDANGNPIMVKRVNDAYPASFEMAVAKAKTAAQFGRTGPGDFHDVSRGGLAIAIDNVCCGGIGVSGEKPAKLELIANAGIDALRTDELTGDDLEV